MTKSRGLLIALVLILAGLVLHQFYPDNAREYRLYLTESRPDVAFQFSELSEDWTEAELKAHFKPLSFQCDDNRPGEYVDERSCFADIHSFNGHGAMGVAFYFKGKKLNRAAVNVPWWSHWAAQASLERTLGQPHGSQLWPHAWVRLHGWLLPNGSALFYNRDAPLNPLKWSGVYWNSKRHCHVERCFVRDD
jgi:hypothetical protein